MSDCGEYFEDTYSPILSQVDRDDIDVEWATASSGWDAISNAYLAAHNLYVQIEAIQGANVFFYKFGRFGEETDDVARLNHIIEETFQSQKGMNCLNRNRTFLEAY